MPKHNPPAELVKIQQWMSTAIRTLDDHHHQLANHQASLYLTKSNYLDSQERLNIYISDYWPRCLDALENDLPGLRKWLGEKPFRQWMTSYLDAYPSRSFTLSNLPQDVIPFLKKAYTKKDKDIVLELAQYEWATLFASFAPHKPAFNAKKFLSNPKTLTQVRLQFEPHLSLLHLTYDWPTWINSKTAKKPKKKEAYIAIFQLKHSYATYPLTKGGYLILKEIEKGCPLHLAIEKAIKHLTPKEVQATESTLQTLFQDAMTLQWLIKQK